MIVHPDTSSWIPCGRTSNSRYFEAHGKLLICIPDEKSTDTESSARENSRFQEQHWTECRRSGMCIVFFDFLIDQTAGARRVYSGFPFHQQRGTALVGGTALSRAIASFFMGLSLPTTPTKMFGSFADASKWCLGLLASEEGRSLGIS